MVVGARKTVPCDLIHVEKSMGPLAKAEADIEIHAPKLLEARIENAVLLDRLRIIDHMTYVQKTHVETDKQCITSLHDQANALPASILTITTPKDTQATTQLEISTAFYDIYTALYTTL
ncbi:hypothetical protein NDU88_005406 [Pleurodeles waltl]|uniref:Uncharacterized protein n=1 Tax=Pleurodeles waltl TaxID=8319 RepID=A0AAV7QH44_PLEWA|nr:hypothetical protein NDU88_005406 [Pleurodeles waltl]